MRPGKKISMVMLLILMQRGALACPFCDQGGVDAAKFILAVFVPFAAAALFILLAVRRISRKMPSRDPSHRIFEAEGKKP